MTTPAEKQPSLVWFRNDLRLADNPAVCAAVERGSPLIPVFIWSPEEEEEWVPGGASRLWLHDSLICLQRQLGEFGSRLVVRRGSAGRVLEELATETGATAVFWNRRYEPAIVKRDGLIKEKLRATGLHPESFNGALLREPWTIRNKSGNPFQVFTPFWKTCLAMEPPGACLPVPSALPAPKRWPTSLDIGDLQLLTQLPWENGIRKAWQPGALGALAELSRFLESALLAYDDERNRPDHNGTSRLSPYLHFGELSPRQIWNAVRGFAEQRGIEKKTWSEWQFLTEIGWREFAHHLIWHFPHTPKKPLRSKFEAFPWRPNEQALRAWQKGLTGYPLVDAGMRQLWTTGWMHNRVRMVTASFLVKNLLISWQDGARWFWDTLVDADLAQNTAGWQWTAGCGADAAPFFRIFNPVSQGEKFDPKGAYIRTWLPELSRLPDPWIHQPWSAPATVLSNAGVILGKTYPERIISHAISREIALKSYRAIQ